MNAKSALIGACICYACAWNASAQEPGATPVEELTQRVDLIESTVDALKKVRLSGYVQTQYQWGEKDAALKVGGPNEDFDKPFGRVGIRRGRMKLAYQDGIVAGVFQMDMTEKGIAIKDVYFDIKPTWFGTGGLRTGLFNRPFGDEISYSSSLRESPERSTVTTTLFPEERDLGGSLILQASKTSPWNFIKLEGGFFAGNGIKPQIDNHVDFIGHFSLKKEILGIMSVGAGVSYYNGGVFQGTENVYTMKDNVFVLDGKETNKGKYAKREYYGADAQFSMSTFLGLTQIRGEYLFGQQPGTSGSTKSPNSDKLPAGDTYIRNFEGGYVIFIQSLGRLPFAAVVKYDWYNPNTKVKGDRIGAAGAADTKATGNADVAVNTLGVGGLWRIANNVRLQGFYEFNNYEKNSLAALEGKKWDVFTLRLQIKY